MKLTIEENLLPEEIGLFHTPKNMDEITEWIEQLNSSERVVATTAAMMMNNMLAHYLRNNMKPVI